MPNVPSDRVVLLFSYGAVCVSSSIQFERRIPGPVNLAHSAGPDLLGAHPMTRENRSLGRRG